MPLNTPLDILHGFIEGDGAKSLLEAFSVDLLPHVYLLVFLMPQYRNVDKGQKATASSLWFKSLEHADMVTKQSVLDAIKHLFRELVCDWIVVPTQVLLFRAENLCAHLSVQAAADTTRDARVPLHIRFRCSLWHVPFTNRPRWNA